MAQVIIIGGGISGLATGFRLTRSIPEAQVRILEKNSQAGGTVATFADQGFRVEEGPNGFLDTKPQTLQLCQDLGLNSRLVAASPAAAKNRYLLVGDQLKPLPAGLKSFLGTNLLSWRAKWALISERFRHAPPPPDEESIAQFSRRRVGPEITELLVDAVVTGIYAGDPELLSAPSCFPRLVKMDREHGSVLKGLALAAKQRRAEAKAQGRPYQRPGKLWSFAEGLGLLIETLVAKLGARVETGVEVVAIKPHRAGDPVKAQWQVLGASGTTWIADGVILACPAYQQAKLLAGLDSQLGHTIGTIPYNAVAVVGLGYRRQDVPISVDGFGFIAPEKTRRDILGAQWCSSLFPGRSPENTILLRALCGGWHRPDILEWPDDRIVQAMQKELQAAMKITANPIFTHLVRWPRAIPQYLVGHGARVAAIEKSLLQFPGLFVGGNSYYGVALNDCTEQGEVLANRMKTYLQQGKH